MVLYYGAVFVIAVYVILKVLRRAELTYVKSTVNGKSYLVQDLPDKQKAADTLANISERCQKLVKSMKNEHPDSDLTGRLVKRYRPEEVSEGPNDGNYTTYTVNKGEEMVFCLRSQGKNRNHQEDEVHKLNILMFVAIHEMAHIASVTIDHTPEFRENFKFLLKQAVKCGVYQDEQYNSNPQYYCGTLVSDNPLIE